MADVRDMHFVAGNRIEDKISQARNDDDPGVGLVGLPTLVRCIADGAGAFYESRNEPRCLNWVVLADIRVNTPEIGLSRSREPDPHRFRCNR